MIPILPMMLAALVGAGADAPGIETAVPPASEVLVERFMDAIPQPARPPAEDRRADPAELQLLAELNPGRIDDIRRILETQAACEAPLKREMSDRTMRRVAAGLGEEKLGRLIRFYEGGDFLVFVRLGDRRDRGDSLSEDEQAELDRMMTAYPLAEFAQIVQGPFDVFAEDPAMDALIQCAFERTDALERQGLRLYAEPGD